MAPALARHPRGRLRRERLRLNPSRRSHRQPKHILLRPHPPSGRRGAAYARPDGGRFAAGPALPGPAWRGLKGAAEPTDTGAAPAAAPAPEQGGIGASPPLSLTFRSREAPGRSGSAMAAPTRRQPRAAGGAVAWRQGGDVTGRGRGEGRPGRAGRCQAGPRPAATVGPATDGCLTGPLSQLPPAPPPVPPVLQPAQAVPEGSGPWPSSLGAPPAPRERGRCGGAGPEAGASQGRRPVGPE